MKIQRRVLVSGRVQGVNYRASTYQEALLKGGSESPLRGYVRNLPDGRVEAVFSGESEVVEAMIQWCRRGPRFAQVTDLEVVEEPVDERLEIFHVQR